MTIEDVYEVLKCEAIEKIYIKIIETKTKKLIYTIFSNNKEKARENYEKYCQYEIDDLKIFKNRMVIYIHVNHLTED